ncbi:hypothetical protein DENIS_0907 [Desulfonema ishimotonii]|uniref:Uncharacterized protein n=1 Tax=Desulfonema ishimotonii TaxID=45657 RepID=A0A401FSN1_9BACT|nr:hypothetical protein DENIS_0907 [Desulfonema ishimotonii]
MNSQPLWISPIHRIPQTIPIQIRIAPGKPDGIFRRPPPGIRVIIPIPEAYQPGVCVIQPACEAEGHGKGGVAVADNIAERIISDPLHRIAGRIRDRPQRAHLIIRKIIPLPALCHGDRHSARRVFEAHFQGVVAIIFV